MKIGIIGAGQVGSSFAKALVHAGHEIMLSSREPNSAKMQALIHEIGQHASAGTVEQTLAYSEVIAVAVGWNAVPEVAQLPGWQGKIAIDMTNRFGEHPRSAAEDLAAMTGARVVKAFNTIGAEHYQDPKFNGQAVSMLIAGDDAAAKTIVEQLATDIGFIPEDIGGLASAKHLERLAELWVYMMRTGFGRDFAFNLIRK